MNQLMSWIESGTVSIICDFAQVMFLYSSVVEKLLYSYYDFVLHNLSIHWNVACIRIALCASIDILCSSGTNV